jgi:hypothetical protein
MIDFLTPYIPYIPHITAVGIIAIILWRAHVQSNHTFNVFDLLVDEKGKASKTGLGQLVAIFTGTWVVTKLTVAGTLTEGIFGLYLAAMGLMAGWSKYMGSKSSKDEEAVVEDASGKSKAK